MASRRRECKPLMAPKANVEDGARNQLLAILRAGYAVVLGSVIIMAWLSLMPVGVAAAATSNVGTSGTTHPPCYFNPLCSCSKAVPDLGVVECARFPLPRVPPPLNTSKLFMLRLVDNGLRDVEPYFLQSTGLYSLEVSGQPLRDAGVPDAALIGLERSLWRLTLRRDQLTRVPSRSLRHLQKLRSLDLAGNDITEVSASDWRGIGQSLRRLVLRDNALRTLPADAFSSLIHIETIDLRGNALRRIDPSVFRDGMPRLARLLLADNLLEHVPYAALAYLAQLRTLDLRDNLIGTVRPGGGDNATTRTLSSPINLDELRLDRNRLTELDTLDFQHFGYVNVTVLDGNPLREIGDGAFRSAKIRELSLRACLLKQVSPAALAGLEMTLQRLDLAGNNLTALPENLLLAFDQLRVLVLRENSLAGPFEPYISQIASHAPLTELDLSGGKNAPADLQLFKSIRNLRRLSVSRMPKSQLDPEDFLGYGLELEQLQMTGGNLRTVKGHAFRHVRGIRRLDLSDNRIERLEDDAFAELGHTLFELDLSHGLSPTVAKLPAGALRPLENLRRLDLSNNKLRSVPDTAFHFLARLSVLDLRDNEIIEVARGTFQSDIHVYLQRVYLQFNMIKLVAQHAFVELRQLRELRLDDCRVERIERRAFMNLDQLERLVLRGNRISTISDEAFQNLPKLRLLDMAHNLLRTFDFAMFDQVGTLALLKVNASHNRIGELVIDVAALGEDGRPPGTGGGLHSNIKSLDLSHNNVSYVSRAFFRPAELSLTHLRLAHNKLRNATWDVFGNMPHLQWLDLRENLLRDIGWDAFKNTRRLQVLLLAGNRLAELHADTFRTLQSLRVVDLARNEIRTLPDGLFFGEGLELLRLRDNQLGRAPLAALSHGAAATLHDLDLAGNQIAAVPNSELLGRMRQLRKLDLSRNRLLQLDEAVFAPLVRLSVLDLSHNPEVNPDVELRVLFGLEDRLAVLRLDNTSLAAVRLLPVSNLRVLSLAGNALPGLPAELHVNMSRLLELELADNDLTAVPRLVARLPGLRRLGLAGNPLTQLSGNTSELPERLAVLDVRRLSRLEHVESDALCSDGGEDNDTYVGSELQELRCGAWPGLAHLLSSCSALRNLHVHVDDGEDGSDVDRALDAGQTPLPEKLHRLTLSGRGVRELRANTLGGLRSHTLKLQLRDTGVQSLGRELFERLGGRGGTLREVTVDVSGDNDDMREFGNPSTVGRPDSADGVFLAGLRIAGTQPWRCDCELGWLETWLRKRRQYTCDTRSGLDATDAEVNNGPADDDGLEDVTSSDVNELIDDACEPVGDDLRLAACRNKNNASLLETLKTELECGWSTATVPGPSHVLLLVVLVITAAALGRLPP